MIIEQGFFGRKEMVLNRCYSQKKIGAQNIRLAARSLLAFIELEFQISSFCCIGDEHVRESKGAVPSDAYQTS